MRIDNEKDSPGLFARAARVYNDARSTDIKLAVASGGWQTIAAPTLKDVKETCQFNTDHGWIAFSAPTEEGNETTLITVYDGILEYDCQIIAVDLRGQKYSSMQRYSSVKDMTDRHPETHPAYIHKRRKTAAIFSNVPLSTIKEFQFQIRPYEWVEFKNVSLKPNFKTGDKVEGARQVNLRSEQRKSAVSVGPAGLQQLIDSARRGSTVIVPRGVYTKPIEINKSLTLKGESRADCVFEVTDDKPAIFVGTRGKGKVTIEEITIKWQLATSDNIRTPFALYVKDSKAEVKNCSFLPLGNFKRSVVAVRADGFSNLTISRCRFEGFEYVVGYGEGTEGTVSDNLIMDCGHQGITLYAGAKAQIIRNVITGSRYHAVRSTGGTLFMKDNLIINNANRGVYLGNKSAQGTISNNVIMGNATGISGFAESKVKIENNIIADSSYAGIGMRNSCSLSIRNNIFQGNERGWILFKEGGKGGNTVYRNTFWKNRIDTENFRKTANSIEAEPGFVDPDNGDFSLRRGLAKGYKQGLTKPQVFKTLWKRWQNRADKNILFSRAGEIDVEVEAEETGEVSDADKMASENFSAEGWALWGQRKLAEAEKIFKKAVSKDPTNANAWNGLGWSQFQQGKPLNAKISLEKCLKINPRHSGALNGLGWIAKGQGKTDEAIGHWENAVAAASGATAALNGLATTYMELEQYDKAGKYYEMWLNVEPDNADAKAGLEKAKAALNRK